MKATASHLPLGLKVLCRAVLPEDAVLSAYDEKAAEALALAQRLLTVGHPKYDALWDAAQELHHTDQRERRAHQEQLAQALDLSKLRVAPHATAQDVIEETVFNAGHDARDSAFWLGMCVAYLIQQSMLGGTEGA